MTNVIKYQWWGIECYVCFSYHLRPHQRLVNIPSVTTPKTSLIQEVGHIWTPLTFEEVLEILSCVWRGELVDHVQRRLVVRVRLVHVNTTLLGLKERGLEYDNLKKAFYKSTLRKNLNFTKNLAVGKTQTLAKNKTYAHKTIFSASKMEAESSRTIKRIWYRRKS